MRTTWLRYLIPSLLLAALVGTWLSRTIIAEQLLASGLRDYGLTDVTTAIDRLELEQTRIAHVGFSVATTRGPLRIDIRNAALAYSAAELGQGRVRELSVELLTAEFQTGESPTPVQVRPAGALEPFTIIAGLRRALRDYVIFDAFLVQHTELRGEAFGVLEDRLLRLSGTSTSSNTSAEISILVPGAADPAVDSRRSAMMEFADSRIRLELIGATDTQKRPALLELDINDTAIAGRYTVEADSLAEWLEPFTGKLKDFPSGTVGGQLRASPEADDRIDALITADMRNLSAGDYRAERLTLQLNLGLPRRYPFDTVELRPGSQIGASQPRIGGIALGDTRLELSGGLSFDADAWQYAGTARAEAVAVKYAASTVLLKDFKARIAANRKQLEASGGFGLDAAAGTFAFALQHDNIESTGSLAVTPLTAIELNAKTHQLSRLVTPWPYAFDIVTGTLELSATANWSPDKAFRLASKARLVNTGGNFDELVFSGLSTTQELDILPKLKSQRPNMVTINYLDSGVTASKISARLAILASATGTQPLLEIRELQGEIFGGTFAGDDIDIDLNRRKNSFRITAKDIDLEKVVETQQLEDITVTGRVDGTLPVSITEKGLSVENGAFINNVRAGTIRYNPASGTDQLKNNPLTAIALDALRDFRYSHLSADVNFTPEGMLTVNLKLKGTSPELETSRPVHLNINTEQNLRSLLKSLRYAEGISAKIDSKVRRHYENQK